MKRFWMMFFSTHSERGAETTRRIDEALARNERASNMLLSAVKEFLEEKDQRAVMLRVHTRKR
ncbi:hypothetical protein [Rhizobium sp. BK068]|jgi:hypothetical protein|uniref:hypothetical protein n=1 Tax=Rhizobium sp. BK068 TaxID=2512130 RepID=UPI001047E946|nr:hypothetical protein [Rhizobium sp. BK068]TCM80553.1 hypothetical protein EV291_1025 [Rhizobium sp. BK068]